jgi:hypothetical protein
LARREQVAAAFFGWSAARPSYNALASTRGELMRPSLLAFDHFSQHLDWCTLQCA